MVMWSHSIHESTEELSDRVSAFLCEPSASDVKRKAPSEKKGKVFRGMEIC
jgi:hypothetical protein